MTAADRIRGFALAAGVSAMSLALAGVTVAEDAIGDIRIIAGPSPGRFTEHGTTTVSQPGLPDTTASAHRQTSVSDSYRIALQSLSAFDMQSAHSGAVYGYEGAFGRSSWSSANVGMRVQTYSIDAIAGYAWLIGERFDVEFTPMLGGGLADWRRTPSGGRQAKVSALYLEGALRLGAWWTAKTGFQVGGDLRAFAGESRPVFTDVDPVTGSTTTLKDSVWQVGGAVVVGFGWRY